MSELAADLLVPMSTPEVGHRLGVLTVTDGAPSTNRGETLCDRLDLMGGLDGRTGIASAMTMRLTGIGSTGERSRFGTRSGIDTPEAVQTVDMPVSTAPSPDLVAGDLMPAPRALTSAGRPGRNAATAHTTTQHGEAEMAVLHARCSRASSSESPTVGTNGHTGRPGKPEASATARRAVRRTMGAARRCGHQVDDSEIPTAAGATTWSERPLGRGLSTGARVGTGRVRQDGGARDVGRRNTVIMSPGSHVIGPMPSRPDSSRDC